MKLRRTAKTAAATGLLFLTICVPLAAAADELDDLKRSLKELQDQTLDLARRIAIIEAEKGKAAPAGTAAQPAPPTPARAATAEDLERRVGDLELGKTAQEEATRSIIRDSLSKIGPQINEFLALSGSIEVQAGRSRGFTGPAENNIELSTAELEFDITANEWLTGSLIVAFDSGTSVTFPTTEGTTSGVDRFTLDRGTVTVGNTQMFPVYVRAGRDVLPFGTSTGLARTSSLSIASPLTIEAFETRATAVGVGFAFPTPELTPLAPPVTVPPVRPMVVGPAVERFARSLGYQPRQTQLALPTPVFLPPAQPPFYGIVNLYEGSDLISPPADFTENVNASLGYRTSDHCGRNYSELRDSLFCPWSLDFHIDFNSSAYNSDFFKRGYGTFLDQIGLVPAIAAAVKATFGPFAVTGEYNEAISRATFIDDAGATIAMQPSAWQVSLAYQFDWNPWIDSIGDQGTYVAIGFSQTDDLAGVTRLIDGEPTRVGFAPESRLTLTAGEWVMEDLELSIETFLDWDYASADGGTGVLGHGFFTSLTYNF